MKARIIVEIDGRNVAEISTDDLVPKNDAAKYDFEYDALTVMLVFFILDDCINGLAGLELMDRNENHEVPH